MFNCLSAGWASRIYNHPLPAKAITRTTPLHGYPVRLGERNAGSERGKRAFNVFVDLYHIKT